MKVIKHPSLESERKTDKSVFGFPEGSEHEKPKSFISACVHAEVHQWDSVLWTSGFTTATPRGFLRRGAFIRSCSVCTGPRDFGGGLKVSQTHAAPKISPHPSSWSPGSVEPRAPAACWSQGLRSSAAFRKPSPSARGPQSSTGKECELASPPSANRDKC